MTIEHRAPSRTTTSNHLRLIRGGRAAEPRATTSPLERADIRTLLASARPRHVLVLGQPGVGKSSLLERWIHLDAQDGRGALVLDPHGRLLEALLSSGLDAGARDRLLLVDPADTEYPFGLNILDAADAEAQDRVVQFMIDLMMTLYLPDQQGPMFHQAIRNGLRLLMATGGVLPQLPMLFTDKAMLRRLLPSAPDPWVAHYFEKVWMPWNGEKEGFGAYLTSKLSPFVEDRLLRNILGQPRGFDLAGSLAQGQIVLVNLSPARIGVLNSRLLGMLLLHQVEEFVYRRPPGAPTVHVYIDEFHEVASQRVASLLAAARKFGVGFVMAHQTLEQLPGTLEDTVVDCVGSLALFRQGAGPALYSLIDALWPRFRERDLLILPDFHAIVRTLAVDGRPVYERLALPRPLPRREKADQEELRAAARRAIARPRAEVEAELLSRLEALRA